MILLREAQEADISGLEQLSALAAEKHPGFLNVPSDPEGWREKIQHSFESFRGTLEDKYQGKYIFVAEDLEKRQIVGVSMIGAQHGTKDSPHFYFQVANEQKYSQTINTGFIHGTLKLKVDMDGPTEIGGLLVDPSYRNHSEKVGRQISFIRFLYISLHKENFKHRIIAELLPPMTKKGKSPLWEAIGRRFTNMDYWEADFLSSKNKEFILSLFPSGKIYVTFLPADARNAIGKVSKDTEPVMHMLKKIGFKYQNQVDPFDGGPHLMAHVDEILPVKNVISLRYGGELSHINKAVGAPVQEKVGLLCTKGLRPFKAVASQAVIQNGSLFCPQEKADLLDLNQGDAVKFMTYY